jgi:predicted  nucleic acid-binding Zn-ribbon protein
MSITTEPSDLEYESLEVHVDKCSLRYEQMQQKLESIDTQFEKIDHRFDRIDEKIANIETDIKRGNSQLIVALIGATGVIIAAFVGVITAML